MPKNVRTLAISAGIAGLVVFAATCGGSRSSSSSSSSSSGGVKPPEKRQTEEERPPIIVSSGSLDLFLDKDPREYPRGEWAGSAKNWYHYNYTPSQNNFKLKEFRVHVLNGEGNYCDDPDAPFDHATKVEIVYGRGANEGTVTMTIDTNNTPGQGYDRLAVTLTETGKKFGKPYLLIDRGGIGIRSLSIDGVLKCTFNQGAHKRGEVRVRQIMK